QMVTDSITLGTTSLTFTQFSAGVTYTAGNGLQLSAGAFSVVADTGIAVSGSGVAIDPAVVVRKYTTAVGNGSATDITVTHNLGTKDVHVQVRDSTTWQGVFGDRGAPTTNSVALHFSAAPASNAYRAIVHA